MRMSNELLKIYINKINSSLDHLNYSLNIVKNLPTDPSKLSEDQMANWEAFTARFSRTVDLFLTKYLKLKIKLNDPAFDGSLRDFLNYGQKINIIADVERFLATRKLRNHQAHDYETEDLKYFFEIILKEALWINQEIPKVLNHEN